MFRRIPWRPIVAVSVLLATVTLFVDYFATHPGVRQQLRDTSPAVLLLLLGLYIVFVGSLSLVNVGTLRLCQTRLKAGESLLLTMYSSIINFFGPLQSGPAFRAVYLKRKHDINLKSYTSASFIYYFFYALFSGLFLLSGVLKWWLVPLLVALVGGLLYVRTSQVKAWSGLRRLARGNWYYLALATLLQVSLLAVIYFVELRTVMPGVSLSQVVIYTGAANLALFVSLTPGAIGFRESFLLASQHLHHIDTGTIVAANTIDRSIYVVLLLLLAIWIFGSHAHRRFSAT